jgi:hypothetical protein
MMSLLFLVWLNFQLSCFWHAIVTITHGWGDSVSKICAWGLIYVPRRGEVAICNYTLLSDGVFVVADLSLSLDQNPLVTESAHLRFYAGAPTSCMDNKTS